jgi:hypothetical protein
LVPLKCPWRKSWGEESERKKIKILAEYWFIIKLLLSGILEGANNTKKFNMIKGLEGYGKGMKKLGS